MKFVPEIPSRRRVATTAPTTATTGSGGSALSREVDTVLVKTASRCNLDCKYCYVYNLGDDSWKSQPKRMPPEVIQAVVEQVGKLSHSQRRPLSVVFHGGEPLLLGFKGISILVEGLKSSLRSDAGLHIQTNGVMLDDRFIDLFARHDVGISISYDGPMTVHDQNRLDRRGRGSHQQVADAISRVVSHPAGNRLFSGLLAVIDPTSNPVEVYEALKTTGAPSFDFLYRDGNYAHLPYGKARPDSTEYGTWMLGLLDHYLTDQTPPRIRVIDDIMRLVLGARGQKEGVGLNEYGIVVIDTDGTVTRNDTLKGAYAGADRFAAAPSLLSSDLSAELERPEVVEYFDLQIPSSPICQACPELGVCGGGMPAHRWSEENGYANPTVFCSDQLLLISAIRSRLDSAVVKATA